MARPCKSVKAMNKNLTSTEKIIRGETENALRGGTDKIVPPKYLSTRRKKIFKAIVNELAASNTLGNLDVYILAQTAIAIDVLQEIDKRTQEDPGAIYDKDVLSAKTKYNQIFFRCCNELSLSPQSRAKLGNINLQAKQQESDPLLKVLGGGKDAN